MDRTEIASASDGFKIFEVDGNELRREPDILAEPLLDLIGTNACVLAREYLSLSEAGALRQAAVDLACRQAARWVPYRINGPDFYHYDANDEKDDSRRLAENRPLRPRRFRITKFMPWNQNSEAFETSTRAVIALRNALNGNPREFGIQPEHGVFTIPQIIHYECGGDFLGAHTDMDFTGRQGLSARIAILTLLSSKGIDFQNGGLFIETSGERLDVDGYAKPGDLAIIDVSCSHGVEPIDPKEQKDVTLEKGRWMMLVPPYKAELHLREN